MICTYCITGEQSRRMLKKLVQQGRSELSLIRGGWGDRLRALNEHSFTVRVLRARRAPGRSPLFFSILLGLAKVGSAQWYIRNHFVKRHLYASLPLPIFQ